MHAHLRNEKTIHPLKRVNACYCALTLQCGTQITDNIFVFLKMLRE